MGIVATGIILTGAEVDLPTDNSPGKAGRIYLTNDTLQLYRDNGTTWDNLTPAGTLPTIPPNVNLFTTKDQGSFNSSTAEHSILSSATLGDKTLPANWWVVGRILHGEMWGTFSSDSTPPTITIRIKIAGTVFLVGGATATLTASLNTKQWHLKFDIICDTDGGGVASFTSRAIMEVYSGTSGAQIFFFADQNNSIDPTTTGLVDVTQQWNTSNVNNAWSYQYAHLWFSDPS